MEYYRVKNWDDFQHYKERNPPWIKLHRALLDDYEFCSLPDITKGHLVLIWLLASSLNGRVPAELGWIQKKISALKPPDIPLLIRTGWLIPEQDASKPLAECKQDASAVLDLARSREERTNTTEERRGRTRTRADGPTETHRALAKQLGVDCASEWECFWDRVESKGKAWFKDSEAAFRNWLRQEAKYAAARGGKRVVNGDVDRGEVL